MTSPGHRTVPASRRPHRPGRAGGRDSPSSRRPMTSPGRGGFGQPEIASPGPSRRACRPVVPASDDQPRPPHGDGQPVIVASAVPVAAALGSSRRACRPVVLIVVGGIPPVAPDTHLVARFRSRGSRSRRAPQAAGRSRVVTATVRRCPGTSRSHPRDTTDTSRSRPATPPAAAPAIAPQASAPRHRRQPPRSRRRHPRHATGGSPRDHAAANLSRRRLRAAVACGAFLPWCRRRPTITL
jgi:hypothetical protein